MADRYNLIIIIFLLTLTAWTAGVSVLYVATGSMEPTAVPGDMIITVPVRKIENGDIVSFKQNGNIVTHRVVGIERKADGLYFQTKGDGNKNADPFPISEHELVGKATLILPTSLIINDRNIPLPYWILGYIFGLLVYKIRVQKAVRV